MKYKCTLEAYNWGNCEPIKNVTLILKAENEDIAIAMAKKLVKRELYAVIKIETINIEGNDENY